MTGANTSGSKWKPFDERVMSDARWMLEVFDPDEGGWHAVDWPDSEEDALQTFQKRIDNGTDWKWRVVRVDVVCQGRGVDNWYVAKGYLDDFGNKKTYWVLQYHGDHFCSYWSDNAEYDHKLDAREHFNRLIAAKSRWLHRVIRVVVLRKS